MANLDEKGKFRQKWQVCQKFIKNLAKYSNEITKRGILCKWRFYEIDKFGKNLFKVWQKRHVDTCRLRKRRIWQGLRQWDNKTGILTVDDFTKMADLRKRGIEQSWTRIHPRAGKTSNEVAKTEILTNGEFRQIWRVHQKFIKGLAKYSNEVTKRGMLIVGDF